MESKKLRIYLSGGMEYATREGVEWRDELEPWLYARFNCIVFHPNTESKKYLSSHGLDTNFRSLKETQPETFRKHMSNLVNTDSQEIAEHSSFVICLWDRAAEKGAGTKGELTIAKYFQKPVYVVTKIPFTDIPAWVIGCTTEFFDSFENLKQFLLNQFHKGTLV